MPQASDTGPSLSGPSTGPEDWVYDAAANYSVPIDTLRSMLRQESGGKQTDPKTGGPLTSPKGAVGLMQLEPSTAKGIKWYDPRSGQNKVGVNVNDPYENLMGGTAYFKSLLDKYGGSKSTALAAYNWGEGRVDKFGTANLPKETRDYIASIMGGEGFQLDAARQKVNSQGEPPPFWQMAQKFPPDMPLDQYQEAQRQYFYNYLAPKVRHGYDVAATFDEFKQMTARPEPSLGTKIALPFEEAGATALRAMTRPVAAIGKASGVPYGDPAAALEKSVYARGAYYGAPQVGPRIAGELLGAAPAVVATAATGGAAAETLFPELAEAAEAAETLQTTQKAFKAGTGTAEEVKAAMAAAKAAKAAVPVYQHAVEGGLAWGALNTIQAEPDENRWAAGARGLVYGGLAGTAMGWLGKLRAAGHTQESADALSRGLLSGDPAAPPATLAEDATLAKEITDSKQASDVSGAPGQIAEAPNPHVDEPPVNVPVADIEKHHWAKGVSVRARTALTQRFPQGRDIRIQVFPGREKEAVAQLRKITSQGGVHVKTLYNPQSQEDLDRFLLALKGEDVTAHVVETALGEAETVAREMRVNGESADAVENNKVLVQPKFAEEPSDDAIRAKVDQLRDTDANGQTAELTKFQKDSIGTAVKKMWDPEVADGKKQNLINGVLRGHDVDDLLPEQWRSEYRVMTPEEREAEAAEARGIEERQRTFEEMQRTPEREVGEAIPPTTPRPRNLYQEVEPLLRRDEPREFRESAPPEIQQGLLAEQYASEEMMQHTVPPSERSTVEVAPNGNIVRRMKGAFGTLTTRPFATAIRTTAERMARLGAGGVGATVPRGWFIGEVADRLGINLEGRTDVFEKPAVVFREFQQREGGELPVRTAKPGMPYADWGTVYHESLHAMEHHADAINDIMAAGDKVTDDIGNELGTWTIYNRASRERMNQEAFVHLATAIRMGRFEDLAAYVRMDGTLEDVLGMVNSKASQIKDALRWVTIDSVPSSIIDRRMSDLIRRTSADPLHDLIVSTEGYLKDYRYNPETRMWHLNDLAFESRKELLDEVAKQDQAKDVYPRPTLMFEARGLRGGIAPPDSAPVKDDLAAVSMPREITGDAVAYISAKLRPTLPWMDTVNKMLKKAGREMPLFRRAFDVDEGQRALDQWLPPRNNKLVEALGKDSKKWPAMLDTLGVDEKYWEDMGKQHNLSAEDLKSVGAQREWADELKTATGGRVDTMDFLRKDRPKFFEKQFQNADGTPDWEKIFGPEKPEAEQGFFERLYRKGIIDPKNRDAGTFLKEVLQRAGQEKFMDSPIRELEKLTDRKFTSGERKGEYMLSEHLRVPIKNYAKYMRNHPDETTKVMYKAINDFTGKLNEQVGKINERMPSYAQLDRLPEARELLNQLMSWSYAATIGAKASVPVRDTMQGFILGMPVLGVARFMRGLARGMTREGYNFAKEAGALIQRENIAGGFGDISGELGPHPSMNAITKFANKILAASSGAHNIVRSVIFNAMHDDVALNAIREYRAGRMSWEDFIEKHNTSVWALPDGYKDILKGRMADSGFSDQEIARSIGQQTVDLLAFPYRRGAQPGILRSGPGRLFGQFGYWPLNFWEFQRQIGSKFKTHPGAAMTTLGTWMAVNYAGSHAMNAMGADQGKWFWWHPGTIDMSPHAQLLVNLGKMWGDTPEARDSRRQVLEYPQMYFPGEVEFHNIMSFHESGEQLFGENGELAPGFLRLLGFKPLKERTGPERDFEQELLYEMGYTERPTGEIVPTLVERERSAR